MGFLGFLAGLVGAGMVVNTAAAAVQKNLEKRNSDICTRYPNYKPQNGNDISEDNNKPE